jgi:serine/threonine protein kinase
MSLRHPNIVTFIGTCCYKNDFLLVTEYLEKESLKKVLEDNSIELTKLDKLRICHDIAVVIHYLHSRTPKVFHRDLKSSNCLVDKFLRVKLCDFGLSKIYDHFQQLQTNSSSTCFWMAPEFIMDGLFTDKADIYSYGILMWEVMMRDTKPFKGIKEITFLIGDKELLKKRPLIPENFDHDIKSLIQSCWQMDYTKRPEINDIVDSLEMLMDKAKKEME